MLKEVKWRKTSEVWSSALPTLYPLIFRCSFSACFSVFMFFPASPLSLDIPLFLLCLLLCLYFLPRPPLYPLIYLCSFSVCFSVFIFCPAIIPLYEFRKNIKKCTNDQPEKLGPQKQDRCCTMPLQRTEYQAWLCAKSPIWAKKNWHGCSNTIRTVGPCTVFCPCALVCQWLPQITWIAAVEFYVGVLGRLLAGFGRPMPSEGPVKKRRRFGTSCPRVSWSGSRPRPPGVSRRLMKTRFSRRAAKETAVFGQGAKAASTPCHTEAVSIGSRVCPPRTQPKGKLAKKALSWTCTLAKQATHWQLTLLTRVQGRHGVFVYRPFPAAQFQKGAKVGRELLLRFLGW